MKDRDGGRDRHEEIGGTRDDKVEELAGKEVTEPDAEEVKGGKVNVQDLSFMKYVDKSSPDLMI